MSADWFGELPQRWSASGSRALLTERIRRGMPDAQMLSVTISKGIVPQKQYLDSAMTKKDNSNTDRSKYKYVEPGDVVYNKMRAWQGAAGCSTFTGIVSPAYVVLRAINGNCSQFFGYVMRTPLFAREAERWSYGITSDQWSLRPGDFKSIWFPVPPIDEQVLIVRYLDNLEIRVARAIQAKERLFDLLTEQRLAVFESVIAQHSLARNLVPGPNWFGDIPDTWNEKRLRGVLSESKIRSSDGEEPHYSMSQRLGLVPARIGGGVLLSADYIGGRICAQGDIVLNRLKAHLGVFAVAPTVCVISPDYTVLRVRDGSSPEFICALLRSRIFRPQLRINVRGLVEGFWRLYTPDLMRLSIPVPPREVQDIIMAEVETRWSRLDTAMQAVREEIKLLQEYRIKLISDVVTGKKDVRAEADGMKDIIPGEIVGVLGGTSETGNDGVEGDDDAD